MNNGKRNEIRIYHYVWRSSTIPPRERLRIKIIGNQRWISQFVIYTVRLICSHYFAFRELRSLLERQIALLLSLLDIATPRRAGLSITFFSLSAQCKRGKSQNAFWDTPRPRPTVKWDRLRLHSRRFISLPACLLVCLPACLLLACHRVLRSTCFTNTYILLLWNQTLLALSSAQARGKVERNVKSEKQSQPRTICALSEADTRRFLSLVLLIR